MVKCDAPGCTKQKLYAPARGLPAQFCGNHSPPDWPDVITKLCSEEGCTVRPIYGTSGGRAMWCTQHKKPNMVDVIHKGRRPTRAGGRKAKKTKPRQTEGGPGASVGRRKRKCEASGCGKTPCYGPEGGPLMFCAEHAGEGDVDTQGQPKPVGWVPPPPSIPRFREGAVVAPRSAVQQEPPPPPEESEFSAPHVQSWKGEEVEEEEAAQEDVGGGADEKSGVNGWS